LEFRKLTRNFCATRSYRRNIRHGRVRKRADESRKIERLPSGFITRRNVECRCRDVRSQIAVTAYYHIAIEHLRSPSKIAPGAMRPNALCGVDAARDRPRQAIGCERAKTRY